MTKTPSPSNLSGNKSDKIRIFSQFLALLNQRLILIETPASLDVMNMIDN
jgi:hypothetical protein